jgi:anti-sigma factor RsiW
MTPDRLDPRPGHPDELLAGYVDGTASPQDLAAAEAHLATCEECRAEVALARRARAALRQLPRLGSPGLAGLGLAGLRTPPSRPTRPGATPPGAVPGPPLVPPARRPLEPPRAPAPERPPPRPSPPGSGGPPSGPRGRTPADTGPAARRGRHLRIPWGAGAAALAAAVVAVAGSLLALRGGAPPALRPPPAAERAAPGPSLPPLVDRGASYTAASLRSLANRLAGEQMTLQGMAPATPSSPGPAPSPSGPALTPAPTAVEKTAGPPDAASCLRTGAGLGSEASVLYLEAASYARTPAFVGAFRTAGPRPRLVVVAVSRQGCQPLYVVNRSL